MNWPTWKLNAPMFFVVATTFGFFSMIFMLYTHMVEGSSKDILQVMIGLVGAKWGDMIGYYFGSSSGSSKKTDIMASAATTLAADTAAATPPLETK